MYSPDHPMPRWLPVLLGFLTAVGPVSIDMYLPAFPILATDFHSLAAPQLTLAAFFAGLGVGQMMQGPLSDRLGRRGPLMVGLVIFTIASLGCALAPDATSLCILRAIAAFGGSAAVVIPRAMVRDMADGAAAARLFAKLMLVMGVAPVLAPILGSLILQVGSWRLIFLVAALFGLVALVLVWRFLPDTLEPSRRLQLGFGGVFRRYGMVITERGFLTHGLVGTFGLGALFAYVAGAPVVFISRYGFSPLEFALMFGVYAMFYIGSAQINARAVGRYGYAPMISFAVVALGLGSLTLLAAGFANSASPLPVMAGLLLCEISLGFMLPSATVGALTSHAAQAGSASALMGTLQFAAGAVTGTVVGLFADGTARPMAVTMLACAACAGLAAWLRPRQTKPIRE